MDLGFNNLFGSLPSKFGKMTKLDILYISAQWRPIVGVNLQ
jgi:hypothetical protein